MKETSKHFKRFLHHDSSFERNGVGLLTPDFIALAEHRGDPTNLTMGFSDYGVFRLSGVD
jgi:hypothetical protein